MASSRVEDVANCRIITGTAFANGMVVSTHRIAVALLARPVVVGGLLHVGPPPKRMTGRAGVDGGLGLGVGGHRRRHRYAAAAGAQHVLATGEMPLVPIEVRRALWRRKGADRRLAELLHRGCGGRAA